MTKDPRRKRDDDVEAQDAPEKPRAENVGTEKPGTGDGSQAPSDGGPAPRPEEPEGPPADRPHNRLRRSADLRRGGRREPRQARSRHLRDDR